MISHADAVAPAERIDALDAVRGVAVLGILLINIDSLSGYAFVSEEARRMLPLAAWDAPVWLLLSLFVEAKFYSLFSFLFGVGFAVFVQRAAARGADAVRLFKRRLAGLLLIGLFHSILIWFGDILVTYALLGFALIPFLRRSDAVVLRWAVAMLALPIGLYALVFAAAALMPGAPGGAPQGGMPPVLADAARHFASGGYADVVGANIVFTAANAVRRVALMFFPRVFGMFLLGFYAGRHDIFGNLDAWRPLVRRVFILGGVVGLPFACAGAALEGREGLLALFLQLSAKSVAIPALSLAYAAGLTLLFGRVHGLMRAFAPAGRMALSNYLLHSVAGVVMFYGIGFGLFGRASLSVVVAGAVAFFVLQMFASRVWLERAAFGPAEWLWRMFTYKRRFALLK